MRSIKSPNLELIAERKDNEAGYIILIFLEKPLCELYFIQIKDMMGMIEIWLETNYISEGYYFVQCFYMTVTVRSTTIITD